ncbi:MAG TPA: Uma2 family endonuclease [Allocoleopsis sp.]
MITTPIKLVTDQWINVPWDEYIKIIENPDYLKAKCYYFQGEAKIEMSPLGSDHASDHSIINLAIHIFAALNDLPLNGKDNCTYRRNGTQELQPDLSFYIGDNVEVIPWGVKIIDLDQYPLPNLVVEIADTTLADDLGKKRILYENLAIEEYWIVDVTNAQLIAFSIENRGSRMITESRVLPGLNIRILTEALQRTRQTYHSEVGAWLLRQFEN